MVAKWSLPGWGEWVEIGELEGSYDYRISLSPDGESGLKFRTYGPDPQCIWSLPGWGEWVEITVIRSY